MPCSSPPSTTRRSQDVTGAAVTPFVLGRIAAATAGRSVPANLALAEHNAAVAAEIAVAVAATRQRLEPSSSPLRSTVTGPSSLTTMIVADESSKL